MKYSFLVVAVISTLGLTACSKSATESYNGPFKAEHAAAVEECKQKGGFDARTKCVAEIMMQYEKK